jgi:ribonuclease HI
MGMWQKQNNALYRKVSFKDFNEALEFINKVGNLAEDASHHPTIKNTYNTVELWLTTHDKGNVVTDKDEALAKAISKLLDSQTKADKEDCTTIDKPKPKKVKMFADGGSRGNPGPSATGYVVMDENDHILLQGGEYLGITTNNQAEYQAVRQGLVQVKKMNIPEVDVFLDSLLVVNQMKGIFKVKNRDLWPIHEEIKLLAKHFKKITFTHVPREFNKLADAMVNQTLDAQKG